MPTNRTFTDQLQRSVVIPLPPQRIVSLVPSQTELLFDLGLADRVVGITKFCVRPNAWFRSKTRVGGTKTLNLQAIRALNPDLILANREENEKAQIEALAAEFPVWISDINNLNSAMDMIAKIGELTGTEARATTLLNTIGQGFEGLPNHPPKTAVYLIWNQPMMLAGTNTFISDMMLRGGFLNLAPTDRYPEFSHQQLIDLNPEVVLLSSEPFPFDVQNKVWFEKMLPNTQILLVDGEMFSWYGSRMAMAPGYFHTLTMV